MIYDVVVIGGGPSGMTAALYALRNNRSVLILEKENFGGQIANSPRVENFPTIEEISGSELADRLFTQVTALGAEFELEEVKNLAKVEDLFEITTNYHTYQAKTVIIATGVTHRRLNLPNEEKFIGKGISFCAVCDGPFYKGKEVCLIGDANSALQYALLLTNYCPKVHMYTLFDKLFGDQILIDRVKNNEKIEITQKVSLIKYQGDEELKGLIFERTDDHSLLEVHTDNVFIAIGQLPHNEVFEPLVDLEKGYIVVDDNMMSKTPGLFAVGDCRKKEIRQLVTACSDGAIAALAANKYLD